MAAQPSAQQPCNTCGSGSMNTAIGLRLDGSDKETAAVHADQHRRHHLRCRLTVCPLTWRWRAAALPAAQHGRQRCRWEGKPRSAPRSSPVQDLMVSHSNQALQAWSNSPGSGCHRCLGRLTGLAQAWLGELESHPRADTCRVQAPSCATLPVESRHVSHNSCAAS